MAQGQPTNAADQLVESLGRKVETFLKGLSSDEMSVFTASLLTPLKGPEGQDAQGFLQFPVKVKPSLPSFCSWQAGGPNLICWVCGTKTMYCQGFG